MSELTAKAMDRQETHYTSWAWQNPPKDVRADIRISAQTILRNRELADRLMERWLETKQLRRAKRRMERKLKRESSNKKAKKGARALPKLRGVSAESQQIEVLQVLTVQRESTEAGA